MRHTPYLDRIGVSFKETVPDSVVTILDAALAICEGCVDWGEWKGKKRKPCPENPVLLAGAPIGQYHCPVCGMMAIASIPHPSPAAPEKHCDCPAGAYDPGNVHAESCSMNYPLDDYEVEYGRPWPVGYEE